MVIDREKYRIGEDNFYGDRSNKKTQIILSFSLRKDDLHLVRLKHKNFGASKKWPTFSISREGNVYEHFDPKYYSDFVNIKSVDRSSISISMENMGSLYKLNGEYFNWLNEKCDGENVVTKKILGGTYWERVYENQTNSLIDLLKHLCGEYDIQKRVIDFHFFNEESKKFNGILFFSNYIEDSQNINPLLDIGQLKEQLK